MNWPSHTDYQDAMQNPSVCFQEPDLKGGEPRLDMLGLPRVMSGNFASVYELKTGDTRWAIRCFVRQVPGQQGRYARLSQHLNSLTLPSLVKFEYMHKGILVKGEWFPIVKMQWVEGMPLNTWVEENLSNPDALRKLAADWRVMMKDLADHKLAHGDLQHGNVMVTTNNELRLVDYDGMYAPVFGRGRAPELGHINFQHPRRTAEFYQEDLDNFSSVVVYTSLLALAAEPDLWQKHYTVDNLILSSADYKNPLASPVFEKLKQSKDPLVPHLAKFLEKCCLAPVEQVPDFLAVMEAADKGTLESLPMKNTQAATSFPRQVLQSTTQKGESVWAKTPLPPKGAIIVPSATAANAPAGAPTPAASAPAAAPKNLSRAASYGNVQSVPTQPLNQTRPVPQQSRPAYPPPAEEKGGIPWWVWGLIAVIIAALITVILIVNRPSASSENESPTAVVQTRPKPAPATAAPAEPEPVQPAPVAVTPAPVKAAASTFKLIPLGAIKASGPVDLLTFSGDGKLMVSASADKGVKLWEAHTGVPLKSFAGATEPLVSAVIVGGGQSICGVAGDNTVFFWDGGTGQVQRKLEDFKNNLFPVAIGPDGHLIATGASNDRKTVILQDAFLGSVKHKLSGHSSWVRAVKFSQDGKVLAVTCHDDSLNLWDTTSGRQLQVIAAPGNADVVTVSADNRFVSAAGDNRELKIWEVSTGTLRRTLTGHNGEVKSCAFSTDGKLLASGSADKTIKVWDTNNGVEKQTVGGFANAVTALAFASAGKILAAGSADSTIKLFEVP